MGRRARGGSLRGRQRPRHAGRGPEGHGMALKRRAPAPTPSFGGTARLEPDIAADRPRTRLGDILVTNGWVARDTVENAIERAPSRRLGETLIADGLLDEVTLARAVSEQAGLLVVGIRENPADPDSPQMG